MIGLQLFVGERRPQANLMKPITNVSFVPKAGGGLWTSTYADGTSAWVRWCESEQFRDTPKSSWWLLEPKANVKLMVIDSFVSLSKVFLKYGIEDDCERYFLDYEKMALDYDGMHLTEEAQWETRLSYPINLYGWDCESTHWFRWAFDKVYHMSDFKNVV